MSIEEAKTRARELTDKAVAALRPFKGGEALCDFAEYLCTRDR